MPKRLPRVLNDECNPAAWFIHRCHQCHKMSHDDAETGKLTIHCDFIDDEPEIRLFHDFQHDWESVSGVLDVERPSVSIEEAQAVVDKHFSNNGLPATIVNFTQVTHGFSYTPAMKTYLLDLAISSNAEPTHSSFLVVSSAPPDPNDVYAPNALPIFPQLISLIRTTTPSPSQTQSSTHPAPSSPTHTSSPDIPSHLHAPRISVPSPCRQHPHTPAAGPHRRATRAVSRRSPFRRPKRLVRPALSQTPRRPVLRLASDLHPPARVPPRRRPPLHPSLHLAPTLEALRPPLARAIGAFLFADVDTPSLVWFTGSADDVFLAFTPAGAFNAFAILPAVAHALWGDPLLEAFFASPGRAPRSGRDTAVRAGSRTVR
ncbi:hypothetical protein B0H13DRAFT_2335881 [Mycena leptocephala]|nr:hypothetical protein B0H13DRAFT_2335881 [Mycena leptocephala]